MNLVRRGAHATELPVGTLTFFRSDVEGSMGLARALGARYDEWNAIHHATIGAAIDEHEGRVVRTEGDAVFAVFAEAPAAARTAIAIQLAMASVDWPADHPFKVRIGMHAGTARRAGDDYGGLEVARAARIADLGWGGQTVLSESVRALLSNELADDWAIQDLGRHRLKGIVEPERIYQLSAPGLPSAFPPLRSGSTPSDHLPERVTSLVGREAELTELVALLADARLLTLTGPGGTGKTTLAVELARRQAAGYGDGAWFVDLQGVHDASDVRAEIARQVGLLDGTTGSAADRLLSYVAERELLLVIDNFEQVIEAGPTVSDILVASPRSRLIVTSRVPLRLSAEQEYPVEPLAMGPAGAGPPAAVQLFMERARRARPGLSLEAETATIEAICEHVDGLPLAIELASASVVSLPIQAIRDRLATHVPLPGSGPRDLPERQRTIEATIAWSHDLLEPPLRRLFARLGVFDGSFELEQVETVCGTESGIDVLEGLTVLVEHSLVHRVDDAIGGIRYGMLETIRAFAAAQLEASGEADTLRSRHMRAFSTLVDHQWPTFEPDAVVRLIDRVEVDEGNVRAAVARAIDKGEVDVSLRMVGLLWRPWLALGRLEDGRVLVGRALALPGAEPPTLARVMALDAAGGLAYWSGDLPAALPCYEEQLRIAETLGDPATLAIAAVNLYFTRLFGGDLEGAAGALELAKRTAEEHGLPVVLARVDMMQMAPLVFGTLRDPEAARPQLVSAIARFESTTDPEYGQALLPLHALLAWIDGDLQRAARSWAASVRAQLARREVADAALRIRTLPIALLRAGGLRAGFADKVATIEGAGQVAFERLGISAPMDLGGLGFRDPTPALVEVLGQVAYDAALERGRHMSLADATDFIEEMAGELPG